MSRRRDIDQPGYPLPCDPITGLAWWRISLAFCWFVPGWRDFKKTRSTDELIPVLRWLRHGAIPEREAE